MKKPYTLEDFFEIMKLFCKEGEKVRWARLVGRKIILPVQYEWVKAFQFSDASENGIRSAEIYLPQSVLSENGPMTHVSRKNGAEIVCAESLFRGANITYFPTGKTTNWKIFNTFAEALTQNQPY